MMEWVRVKKSHPEAVEMANRHYSRAKYGKVGKLLGPPGRLLCLMLADGSAVWVSHWPYPELALDRMDSWRCTMFRNEGPALSSTLIREAMVSTFDYWGGVGEPVDGWVTWVDADEVASSNPGYCFQRAGWEVDRGWRSTRKNAALIRLRHLSPLPV
jgi:hypothetical protein